MDTQSAVAERPDAATDARRIGRVTSISGCRCACMLADRDRDGVETDAYREGQIGAIVRVDTEQGTATFGFIDSVKLEIASGGSESHAVVEIELFGENPIEAYIGKYPTG